MDIVAGEAELRSLMQRMLFDCEAVPGVIVVVEAPRFSFEFAYAAGTVDISTGSPLTVAHPVRIASNTKTYVAVAILRLWEQGLLDLDAPISRYLPSEHVEVMCSGGYDPDLITARHLLTHTSGLFDYSDSARFIELVAPGNHRWTRLEQLQGAMAWGDAYGKPGEVYRYSDTRYNELGEIIEQISGQSSYGAAVRDLVGFERLGLRETWLENLEAHPTGVGERARQYLHGIDISEHDPSEDLFGGGGLVATVPDLMRFYQAVFTGEVFQSPDTLVEMLSTVEAQKGGPVAYGREQKPGEYRCGIFADMYAGHRCYAHSGYFGTLAAYFPELGATVALTVNVAETEAGKHLLGDVANVLGSFRA